MNGFPAYAGHLPMPLQQPAHIFCEPLLREIGLYQPPMTRRDVWLRSHVQSNILAHLEAIVRKILPGGRREGNVYRAGPYIVAIRPCYETHTNSYLYAAQWIDLRCRQIGRDAVELFAHKQGIPYQMAIIVLADQFDLTEDVRLNQQCGKLPRMTQELRPLHISEGPPLHNVPPGAVWATYRNTVGAIIGIVARIRLPNGEVADIHYTLWRGHDSPVCQWVETFPQKPFPIFNADLIAQRPDAEVILAVDEFIDIGLIQRHRSSIFSAIPGGHDNILDADLNGLRGRMVRVILRPVDLSRGKLIEQKLRSVGVESSAFSLSLNDNPRPFDSLAELAIERGIDLIEPPSDAATNLALVAVTAAELLDEELPPRGYVLEPIISEQGLTMVHAPRGIGKTHFGLGCAFAVATGESFLGWQAPKAQHVLYLDGEMPATAIQERVASIAKASLPQGNDLVRFITPDMQNGPMPDISTPEGQAAIEPFLDGISLVVLDNLSTLCRSGRENDADSWGSLQGWLLDLRRRGIAVLIIHHSGKSGRQRGTSRREDVLDTVISLRRPDDYSPSQGARFEVHIEKGRGIFGAEAAPFEARLEVVDGKVVWTVSDEINPLLERACELFHKGKSVRAVANELGISKSAAGRLREKMVDDQQGEDCHSE